MVTISFLQLINTIYLVIRYKINIQISVAFLCNNDDHKEKVKWETMAFTKASKQTNEQISKQINKILGRNFHKK